VLPRPKAKARIAQLIQARMDGPRRARKPRVSRCQPEQSLRQVAVLVRNLDREIRDGVLEAIRQKDKDVGDKVTDLMVIWEDLPLISGRIMQQALRGSTSDSWLSRCTSPPRRSFKRSRPASRSVPLAMVDEESLPDGRSKKEDVHLAARRFSASCGS